MNRSSAGSSSSLRKSTGFIVKESKPEEEEIEEMEDDGIPDEELQAILSEPQLEDQDIMKYLEDHLSILESQQNSMVPFNFQQKEEASQKVANTESLVGLKSQIFTGSMASQKVERISEDVINEASNSELQDCLENSVQNEPYQQAKSQSQHLLILESQPDQSQNEPKELVLNEDIYSYTAQLHSKPKQPNLKSEHLPDPHSSLEEQKLPASFEKLPSKPSRSSQQFKQPALHYVAEKAGMQDIDKEKIQKLIMEASKGSDYFNREMKRSEEAKEKAREYKKKIEQHQRNEKLWKIDQATVKGIMLDAEKSRDFERTWAHIDMDMFFAAVEIRDDPSLADKPVAIGGQMMISTANYVARKFGVRAAMPGFIAKKLCPELVFIDCNFKKYKEVSIVFKGILEQYDPDYESMGCDEANLDLTNIGNCLQYCAQSFLILFIRIS